MTAEDGYRLWLRYEPVADAARLAQARALCASVYMPATTPTLAAARNELARGLAGMLGAAFFTETVAEATLIVGTPLGALGRRNEDIQDESPFFRLFWMTTDAFVIDSVPVGARRALAISSFTDAGVLYGVFHFLRHLQTGRPLDAIDAASGPRIGLRMLDHWDNLDGSIERGYAGRSLWRLGRAAGHRVAALRDYARANASIGINARRAEQRQRQRADPDAGYLRKVAALADVFRPYGIRVFLSARFSAPIEIGGAATADPLDPAVAAWWREKVDEIYALIPDFGGFLVKANSEGQPGPQDYGRTHADGANMLADALAPHGGVVIWRAFVYKADVDRGSRQAGVRRVRAARRHVPAEREAAGEERPDRLPAARAVPPAVRRDAAHAD